LGIHGHIGTAEDYEFLIRTYLKIGFCVFTVIDPKIPPLTLTLSPKGRGDRISPPSRGGDKGEGDIFMFLCEPLAHVDSRNPECFREVGNPSENKERFRTSWNDILTAYYKISILR
jgi:hypothetical protein